MLNRLLIAGVFIGALSVLLTLSYWQFERLKWKKNIIDQLNVEYNNNDNRIFKYDDLAEFSAQELPIKYGSVKGRFLYDREILVGPKPLNKKIGYRVITPLKFPTGKYILVNRGWIEENQKDALQNKQPNKIMTVTGIFRKPDWKSFTPNNSPENNIWTKLDIEQIATAKDIQPVSSVMLYATQISEDFAPIILQQEKWYPRNKHLQYAIFWLTMAFALISVFGIFAYKKKKSS